MPTVTDPADGKNYPVSASSWQWQLLNALGAPETYDNIRSLTLWAQSEGTDPKNNNWLATSLKSINGQQIPFTSWIVTPSGNGGDGIPAYPSQAVGVQATAATIEGYPAIVAALKAGTRNTPGGGPEAIWTAINNSSWCRGCQNGDYPVALHEDLLGVTPSGLSAPNSDFGNSGAGASGGTGGSIASGGKGGTEGATGQTDCAISIGSLGCLLSHRQLQTVGGYAVMVGGATIMLVGTIVILFRFQGTQGIATAAAGAPLVGGAARAVAGRSPSRSRPARSGARSSVRVERQRTRTQQERTRTAETRAADRRASEEAQRRRDAGTDRFVESQGRAFDEGRSTGRAEVASETPF